MSGLQQMVGVLVAPPVVSRAPAAKAPRQYNRQGRKHGSGVKDRPIFAAFDALPIGSKFRKADLLSGADCSLTNCNYVISKLINSKAAREIPRTEAVTYGAGQAKWYRKVAERPGKGQ